MFREKLFILKNIYVRLLNSSLKDWFRFTAIILTFLVPITKINIYDNNKKLIHQGVMQFLKEDLYLLFIRLSERLQDLI